MIRNILSIFCLAVVLFCGTSAQAFDWLKSENGDTREGNAFLAKKENAKALASYDKAAKTFPNRGEVHLNRGLALSRIGDEKLDEAMQALTLATDSDAPRPALARAEFNLANAFLKKEDYKAAIEHYKKSLMLQPGNRDAAWNLEVARQKKKKQEEQQKQNQDNQDQQNQGEDGEDQENKDQQDQENKDQNQQGDEEQQKQDEQKQDEQKQDEQKQDEQKQPEEQKQDEQKQDEQPQDEQDKEKQEQPAAPQNQSMEQMLNALDKQDNDFHKNKARQRAVGVRSEVKDW